MPTTIPTIILVGMPSLLLEGAIVTVAGGLVDGEVVDGGDAGVVEAGVDELVARLGLV